MCSSGIGSFGVAIFVSSFTHFHQAWLPVGLLLSRRGRVDVVLSKIRLCSGFDVCGTAASLRDFGCDVPV